MPGDHSELEPPLPIPNRSVKQLRADDSADSRVKVGHRQALIPKTPRQRVLRGVLSFPARGGERPQSLQERRWKAPIG